MEGYWMMSVKVILLAIVFLGLLVEVKTGGLGAGALLGIVAAGVFFGSQYVQGLVSIYQIGIFLAGLLCVVIELLMPTVGLLAGAGVAAMLYSVVLALGGDIGAIYAMLTAMTVAILIFAVIVRRLPSSSLWKRFVLSDSSTAERGYVGATVRTDLVGCTGKTETELRPAGRALLAGAAVDVVSDGSFIPRGTAVVVVAAEGSRVVVRAL